MTTKSGGKLLLPALTISRIAPQARGLLTSLLLLEIGQTYGTSIGITNQIKTANSFLAIFSALAMGILSVKTPNHRTLPKHHHNSRLRGSSFLHNLSYLVRFRRLSKQHDNANDHCTYRCTYTQRK